MSSIINTYLGDNRPVHIEWGCGFPVSGKEAYLVKTLVQASQVDSEVSKNTHSFRLAFICWMLEQTLL